MATYSLGSAGDLSSLNDFEKVQSYLFKMNENLRYTFSNLTVEDNFASGQDSSLTYVSDGETQAAISPSLSGITLEFKAADGSTSSMVLSKGDVTIEAEEIELLGNVNINSLVIDSEGVLEGTNANFTGDLSGTIITGNTFNGSVVNSIEMTAESYYTKSGRFYAAMNESETGMDIGLAGFYISGEVLYSNAMGSWTNPASSDSSMVAINGTNGAAGFTTLYVAGVRRDIASEISRIWEAIENLDDESV